MPNPLALSRWSRVAGLSLTTCALVLMGTAQAKEGNATQAEATAMVKKGVAFVKTSGKDKAYAEISNKAGQFTDRDLYLVV
jgi:cytochrome c